MTLPAELRLPQPLYFFDGHCVLCSGFVAFCLAHDPAGKVKFASTQSALGQRAAKALDLPAFMLDRTILLIDGDKVYCRSTAVLRACRHLAGWPRWLTSLSIVPAFVRDPFYDLVARNRYRWFGRRTSCFVPTAQTRDRFIDL